MFGTIADISLMLCIWWRFSTRPRSFSSDSNN